MKKSEMEVLKKAVEAQEGQEESEDNDKVDNEEEH